MRYLGSKAKLLDLIAGIINKHKIEGEVFADLFSGTGCVGDYFKDRYTIQSNDFLYSSYIISKAKIMNPYPPKFSTFVNRYKMNIFDWLNAKQFEANENYYIYNNYTPVGERMFFTEENGLKIDGVRITIEELFRDKLLDQNEYNYLLASLLESVTKVSNTSGTYEAFFKFWDSRATKPFEIMPLEINEVNSISKNNQAYNMDANKLVRKIKGDIAYIDPPYTVTQYISAYHMLETIAKYDFPDITGVGGKRGRGDKNSLYAKRSAAKEQFEDLLRQVNYRHILISYSNQGLVSVNDLVSIAELFAVDNKVHVEACEYREYQNHRSSNKRNGKKLKEVIIYFEKDLTLAKSPLNYSGSKDTLLPAILKELPYRVGTFMDVMGGAFNVGANVFATVETVYNELNPHIYGIINWILNNDRSEIIDKIEAVINEFGLSKRGKEEYLELRNFYNLSHPGPLYLFVLHMYSFQNMIRFNGSQIFNTPVGVAGYSEDIKNRLERFRIKAPKVTLLNQDYINIRWEDYPSDTVFYFDPPYFITNAAYNDGKRGSKGWGADEEVELLTVLSKIDALGYKFMLSNVLYHNGKTNNLLLEWINEHHYTVVNVGESGWRYSKNEVIIKNY